MGNVSERDMLAGAIDRVQRRISGIAARCAADCAALSRASLALRRAREEMDWGGSLAEVDRLILVARDVLDRRRGEVKGNGTGPQQGR